MASSIAPLSFLLMAMFLSSYLHVGLCQTSLDQLLPGLGQSDFLQDAKCMQKLLPCQSYMKTQTTPSEACCVPLKELNEDNSQCLCNFVNKPALLQSIGSTKDDLLKLPQACGIEIDLSRCNNTEGSQDADSTPAAAAEGEESSSDEDISETTSSTKLITPHGIIYFGVPGFIALLSALVFLS